MPDYDREFDVGDDSLDDSGFASELSGDLDSGIDIQAWLNAGGVLLVDASGNYYIVMPSGTMHILDAEGNLIRTIIPTGNGKAIDLPMGGDPVEIGGVPEPPAGTQPPEVIAGSKFFRRLYEYLRGKGLSPEEAKAGASEGAGSAGFGAFFGIFNLIAVWETVNEANQIAAAYSAISTAACNTWKPNVVAYLGMVTAYLSRVDSCVAWLWDFAYRHGVTDYHPDLASMADYLQGWRSNTLLGWITDASAALSQYSAVDCSTSNSTAITATTIDGLRATWDGIMTGGPSFDAAQSALGVFGINSAQVAAQAQSNNVGLDELSSMPNPGNPGDP